jgi:hypothetical protein
MSVPMLIQGSPFKVKTGSDPRFWYWHGASGRKYIHSVYRPDSCPPLPGAIYVAIRVIAGMRVVLSVGRFPPVLEGGARGRFDGATEVHVHLLARDDGDAEHIRRDLDAAIATPDLNQAVRLAA